MFTSRRPANCSDALSMLVVRLLYPIDALGCNYIMAGVLTTVAVCLDKKSSQ